MRCMLEQLVCPLRTDHLILGNFFFCFHRQCPSQFAQNTDGRILFYMRKRVSINEKEGLRIEVIANFRLFSNGSVLQLVLPSSPVGRYYFSRKDTLQGCLCTSGCTLLLQNNPFVVYETSRVPGQAVPRAASLVQLTLCKLRRQAHALAPSYCKVRSKS